ncbi:MAG: ferredoxin reductase family protein [Rhizobiaceae bacterium]
MRFTGLVIVGVLFALPLFHFAPLLVQKDPIAVLSQYAGFVSLIAMGQIMVLATRWPGIELLFGSLDRVYLLHKWLGVTALTSAVLHEAVDPEIRGMEIGGRFGDLAEQVGELGYNALLVMVTISLLTFIPYHWWRQSHKLMGIIFALAAFHTRFIEKSFANDSAMGLYILALSAVGLIAYLYTLLPATLVKRMKPCSIVSVEDTGEAVSIVMRPNGKGIPHRAGQFAFLKLTGTNHSETHPFTISNAPSPDGNLRFTIKLLGDGTIQLADSVEAGQTALVSQAFGHFTLPNLSKPQIWIAGGVGITPYLAWLGMLPRDHAPISLYICCKSRTDIAHLDAILDRELHDSNFNVHIHSSQESNRLTLADLTNVLDDAKNTIVSFCGPEALREDVFAGLSKAGVKRKNLRYEEFVLRSGLPLRALVQSLSQYWITLVGKIRNLPSQSRHSPTT